MDRDELLRLHRRLVDGGRTASEEIATALLGSLTTELSREFPTIDIGLVWDGVTDALLDYCAEPTAFDADRGVPLDRYLHRNAWRNVANFLRQEKRRKIREEKSAELYPVVELSASAGNPSEDNENSHRRHHLLALLKDTRDRQVLELRLQGERRTSEFAKALGISHLPIETQRLEVKKAKDRISKVISRKKGSNR
jgi:DNA-directed RNA polymerase specialized sigma24 family protein